MEKDKLYKQASLAAYNYANPDGDEPCLDMDFYEGFKQGAEWLQSQPITDRLTEGERENILKWYNKARQEKGDIGTIDGAMKTTVSSVVMFCLTDIFGKEMFEPKNNNI